jgi:serine/threonine protein kinase/C-terminal processing protease CtpA/Prc
VVGGLWGADGARSGSHYFALPTGSRLYEFEIEALLGHGGFGITYCATDTLLQETVAIKEFLPNELAVRVSDATVRAKSGEAQPDFDAGLKSFLEEARVMARFRHPRIVHVRRFFELHGTGYIVLDYESGRTLSERLSDGPIPDPELRSLLSGVLDGLEVIHDRAILHRDLKPNNIMLREDGAPVIIDFGAARDFQARHSRSITAIATAGYAPPEQYGVGGQQGPWSDLYALGAIAYRAVSGEPPVDSLRRLRKDPLIPAVVAGAGKYDEALLRTIDWMLKIDEEDRPVSVAQVREALRGGPVAEAGSENSHPVPDKPRAEVSSSDGGSLSGIRGAAHPPARRGRVAAIAISLVVLAGLAAGSYAFYANHQATQQATRQAERQTQQAHERQRQLTEQLANAGTDPSKLERFLTACGSTCPDAMRTEAQARIDTVKQQKQAELARQDEAAYRATHGDLIKLRAYDTGCNVCAFRDAARSDIALIEQQQQRQGKLAPQQTVSRGTIGVKIQPVTPEIANSLGLRKAEGALVVESQSDGSAAQAGIEPGDVITAVNGEMVKDAREFARMISRLVPGNAVKLDVFQKGQNNDITLTLGQLPNSNSGEAKADIGNGEKGDVTRGTDVPQLGLTLTPANSVAGAGREGVVVTKVDPNSAAAQRGFKLDDVILEVAGRSVANAGDVRDAINAARADNKNSVLMRIKSGGSSRYVAMPLAKG